MEGEKPLRHDWGSRKKPAWLEEGEWGKNARRQGKQELQGLRGPHEKFRFYPTCPQAFILNRHLESVCLVQGPVLNPKIEQWTHCSGSGDYNLQNAQIFVTIFLGPGTYMALDKHLLNKRLRAIPHDPMFRLDSTEQSLRCPLGESHLVAMSSWAGSLEGKKGKEDKPMHSQVQY